MSGLPTSVCVFWLAERCFGLETSMVGEVVSIERTTPVPLVPPAVLGLFNLRGTPVALIDLAAVLGLHGVGADVAEARDGEENARTALVLRGKRMLTAALIHRMALVLPAGRGVFTVSEAADEHPAVKGFLEVPEHGYPLVTLLDPDELMARFERLKFR